MVLLEMQEHGTGADPLITHQVSFCAHPLCLSVIQMNIKVLRMWSGEDVVTDVLVRMMISSHHHKSHREASAR